MPIIGIDEVSKQICKALMKKNHVLNITFCVIKLVNF